MISWNDCDVRIADHGHRIARAERVGQLAPSPASSRERRAAVAAVVARMRHAAAAFVLGGHRLAGSGRAVAAG